LCPTIDACWRATVAILGIVGGIAPPSTMAYYRATLAAYLAATGRSLKVVISSVDSQGYYALLEGDQLPEIRRRLLEEIARLRDAGADVAIVGSNTGHFAWDELVAASPLPLVSIVDAVADALVGRTRVGLFATGFTVRNEIYQSRLGPRGITCVVPPAADQERLGAIYFGELANGVFRDESRVELLGIAARLRDSGSVEAIVLGGTELPLLLTEPEYDGLAFVDSGQLHAEAAVARVLEIERATP
jgi:aspartate racemase